MYLIGFFLFYIYEQASKTDGAKDLMKNSML